MTSDTLKEHHLYPPLKAWLEAQGWRVRGEVGRCDIAAERNGALIVVELKLRPSLTLLAQAAERQRCADSVYAALPRISSRGRHPAGEGFRRLLRRLGIGLIIVTFLKTKTRVEVVLHPAGEDRPPRHRPRRKAALIREIAGRDLDLTPGGLPGGAKRISAYRQRCVQLAVLLSELGPNSPARLKQLGAHQDAGAMLARNLYGWFERVHRGLYRIHPAGEAALKELSELADFYRESRASRESDRLLPVPEGRID